MPSGCLRPRWLQSQLRADAALAGSVQSYNQQMNEIHAGMAAAQAPLGRLPLGVIELRHAHTGQTVRVQQNGSQDHWQQNSTGEAVGTNRAQLPAIDFTRLFPAR